jgi:hypothetical protein
MVVPSLKDLEFDAPAVSRWFPTWHVSQVCGDRPYPFFLSPNDGDGVPTETLRRAVEVEGSIAKLTKLWTPRRRDQGL